MHESGFHGKKEGTGVKTKNHTKPQETHLLSFSFQIAYWIKKEKKELSGKKFWKKASFLYSHGLCPRHKLRVWPPKETQQCPLVIQVKFSCVTWTEKWASAPTEAPDKWRGFCHLCWGIMKKHIQFAYICTVVWKLCYKIYLAGINKNYICIEGQKGIQMYCARILVASPLLTLKMTVVGRAVLEDGTAEEVFVFLFAWVIHILFKAT